MLTVASAGHTCILSGIEAKPIFTTNPVQNKARFILDHVHILLWLMLAFRIGIAIVKEKKRQKKLFLRPMEP